MATALVERSGNLAIRAVALLAVMLLAGYFNRRDGKQLPGSNFLTGLFLIVPFAVWNLAALAAWLGASLQRNIALGGSIGWYLGGNRPDGGAYGDLEWYQRGFIAHSALASVVALGLLRGLCVIPAALWDHRFIGLAVALPAATALAVVIAHLRIRPATRTDPTVTPDDAWAMQEWTTPAFAIALTLAFNAFMNS